MRLIIYGGHTMREWVEGFFMVFVALLYLLLIIIIKIVPYALIIVVLVYVIKLLQGVV